MRVLANDDVYEATRHRMVAVEELHKKSWYSLLDCYHLKTIYFKFNYSRYSYFIYSITKI